MASKNQAKLSSVAKKLGLKAEDFIYVGEGLWCLITDISPAKATDWLTFNTGNRKFKERSIAKMAEDLVNGAYELTHEGLAFGYDCELKDGQNRLQAIIRSGKTKPWLVWVGLTNEAKGVINQGVNRTPLDAAQFAGIETNKLALSSSKLCEVGMLGNTRGISNSKALQLLEKHKEAFAFVQDNVIGEKPVRGVAVAAICAAVMRAYSAYKDNSKKLNRLKKFCQILQDGQWNRVQEDVSVWRLRETAIKSNWGGSTASRELYCLTESAIISFQEQKIIKSLRPVSEEQFPTEAELAQAEPVAEAPAA